MRECIDQKKIHLRLKRIEGQIRGLTKMIDEDIPCEDILIQISAAKKALHKVGQIILEGHMEHCVVSSIKNGDEKEALKKLSKAIEQFSRLG